MAITEEQMTAANLTNAKPFAMVERIAELEAGIQALVSLSNARHQAAAEAKK